MKKTALLIILSSFTTILFSQNIFKRNVIYFELGGNGLFTSVNFERQITKHPGFGIRLGIGLYSLSSSYLTIPLGVNYLFKLNDAKSFIDLGFGVTYTKADVSLYSLAKPRNPNSVNTNYLNFIPSLGYRRQTNKNLMWRVSLTPVFNQYDGLPFFGVSIGKVF